MVRFEERTRQFLRASHLSELAGFGKAHFRFTHGRSSPARLTLKADEEESAVPSPRRVSSNLLPLNGSNEDNMRRLLSFLAIFLTALLAVRSVGAAPQRRGTGILTGVVLGPDDRPVPHAAVTYQSSAGNAPHAVHADSQGRFTITKLKSDNYDLRASGKGVFSEWEKNISVRSGHTQSLTLRLIYAKEVPKAYVKSKPQH
jgi:hypothetical protein